MHPSGRRKEDVKRDLPILPTRCLKCKKCMGKGIVERVKKSKGGSHL